MAISIPKVTNSVKDNAANIGAGQAGNTVFVLGVASGAASLLSSVTAAGTTPPTVTVSGYPTITASIKIDIQTGGARATATFRWSIDNGATWVESDVLTAATYTLPNTGITVAFAAGTYAADNEYTFTCAPIQVEGYTSSDECIDDFTSGPGVEQVCEILTSDEIGTPPTVYFVPIPASVAGTNSSVTASNGSAPAVTLSGAPKDDYAGKVLIVVGGARDTATFKYSLDGGNNYSAEIATAATYEIPGSGITLNFASGTYVAADYYTFDSVAPGYTTTDLAAAYDAVERYGLRHKFSVVVGMATGASDSAKATNAATFCAAINTAVNDLRSVGLSSHAIMSMPFVSKEALTTAFVGVNAPRVTCVSTPIDLESAITKRKHKRPGAMSFASLAAKIPQSVDASSKSEAGPLSNRVKKIYNDERVNPSLNAQRFTTFMTWPDNIAQFYVTNPLTMASHGSDFELMQIRLVGDRVEELVKDELAKLVSKRLLTQASTGYLTSAEANAIDKGIRNTVLSALDGDLQDFTFKVARNYNVFTNKKIKYEYRFRPFAYAKEIEGSGAVEAPNV